MDKFWSEQILIPERREVMDSNAFGAMACVGAQQLFIAVVFLGALALKVYGGAKH